MLKTTIFTITSSISFYNSNSKIYYSNIFFFNLNKLITPPINWNYQTIQNYQYFTKWKTIDQLAVVETQPPHLILIKILTLFSLVPKYHNLVATDHYKIALKTKTGKSGVMPLINWLILSKQLQIKEILHFVNILVSFKNIYRIVIQQHYKKQSLHYKLWLNIRTNQNRL